MFFNLFGFLGNAAVILVAGFDSNSTGLMFTFYLLAKHQDIQEQLRTELLAIKVKSKNVFENNENHCLFDDNRCELLDRIWFESLRLYPPVVTFITRELDDNLKEDFIVLSKSGVKVTKEMTIQVGDFNPKNVKIKTQNHFRFQLGRFTMMNKTGLNLTVLIPTEMDYLFLELQKKM